MTAPREDAATLARGEPVHRAFRPEDKPGIIAVIKSVYDDFNYIIDFNEFETDLVDIQSTYQDAEAPSGCSTTAGRSRGASASSPRGDACELKRLYSARRTAAAAGTRLLGTARGLAMSRGFRRMVLWSDVLLTAAHGLYLKTGFRPLPGTRAIDPTNPTSVERFFEIDL